MSDTRVESGNTALPWWKNAALHLYYYGSLPYRRAYCCWAACRGRMPAAVLFYHRVADDRANSWTTHPSTFARHMDWLRAHCDMVSLPELQTRIRQGHRGRISVSVTFDDGYAENCRQALPLLIRHGIPCTYFVSLRNVLEGKPFSHDLARGHRFAPNTVAQLRSLAEVGVEIGAHGYDHLDLGAVSDPQQLDREILGVREKLQQLIGRPVRYFAFPFGQTCNISRAAMEVARRGGLAGVCSAYGAYNLPGQDPFHVRRFHADDDLIRLKNWITLDPRKLRLRFPSFDGPSPSGTSRDVPPEPAAETAEHGNLLAH